VKIHENVLANTGQQPFLENVEGEIYIYNNLILCLRSASIGTKPPGQPHAAVITSADGRKGRGYTGPSSGNLIFANNVIYNCTSFLAINGSWPSNSGNNVVITGNVMINCKYGSAKDAQYFCENTSVWWDLPGVVWHEFHGNEVAEPSSRYFGTMLHKNPGLIDPAALNFHPASAGSAVVGLSKNLTEYGITTDFDGNPRPATGNWTAGPYEWTGHAETQGLQLVPVSGKK
jgi:hypothetical protein